MFFHFLFFFGCCYTENPLFSLSKSPAHMMGVAFWDSNDAAHWLVLDFKVFTRGFPTTTTGVLKSDDCF